ncbi:response regulator [Lacisediminimonas sp.]|uniref:response regulator n=1 Tax=Lacisediminimonas sp. TaxID=3060582 RepID=UPI002716131F|nr:response regulator [Lacisediminimonas sp.]MDO8299134.1 response regulator [Lacisediminimonas sp.]
MEQVQASTMTPSGEELDLRQLLATLRALRNGDFRTRMPDDQTGLAGKIADTVNEIIDMANGAVNEFDRVGRLVGKQGRVNERIALPAMRGSWEQLVDAANGMTSDLVAPMNEMTRVISAVADGDLSRQVPLELDGLRLKGQHLRSAEIVNTMVLRLGALTSEVTRVAREMGTEGKLGGQVDASGMSGSWKDLTDKVNVMAANLTNQMRGIARVVTAVANGDLQKKLTVEAQGEIADLADTINEMTCTLAVFADQVSAVAREVGVEGKLGGQALVPHAAGTWQDLTGDVNGLATNLTNQMRAIAEVARAVTKGDFTRSVQVSANGEVAQLKDNVNEMIRNLRETTRQNADQDWLKTNLAHFTRLLQGQRDLTAVAKMVLSGVAPLISAHHALFYFMDETQYENPRLKLLSTYAYHEKTRTEWRIGEGLVGQCAHEKKRILLTNVPGDYVPIRSGIGQALPLNIILIPILFENRVKAVLELASFSPYSRIHEIFLDQLGESIGIVVNTIEANMRTEDLLKQSQSLAQELQIQQEELRQTNEELEDKAALLEEQKAEVERKNQEVEITKLSLVEKAEQLTLTSKYKSEFLSSMSHELRTPLNSLLILAQQLSDNIDQNLTPRQVEYARTIQSSGRDLLGLINEILDLSKIESGTVTLDYAEQLFADISDQMERTFRPIADSHSLSWRIDLSKALPPATYIDGKRLLQILKNLLSNAFKFTERGGVTLTITNAESGWSVDHDGLNSAGRVIAFIVTDTGIGIAPDKQKLIFEAFQQADAGTSRRYSGTGLGLSISRELANLLGGELRLLRSEIDEGSAFALFAPLRPHGRPARPMEDFYFNAYTDSGSLPLHGELPPPVPAQQIPDDREQLKPDVPLVMIIENDAEFATVLLQAVRDNGLHGVVAVRGGDALAMAEQYTPSAITLNNHLPDIDGWLLLERLKRNPALRHIPVQVISAEPDLARGRRNGAFGSMVKAAAPADLSKAIGAMIKFAQRKQKDLLLLCSDGDRRTELTALLGSKDVRLVAFARAQEAIASMDDRHYDCIVIDTHSSQQEGALLLAAMHDGKSAALQVVMAGEAERNHPAPETVRHLVDNAWVRAARSQERLLNDVALLLHRRIDHLPPAHRMLIDRLHEGSNSLEGRTVLVVDDDVRNIFALASVLERHKMQVVTAETGQDAIGLLHADPNIELVLMDIMMPEMDGYETMQSIRNIGTFDDLPIIALTAKAMKEDRAKCIAAGASDYISKPVDTDQLLAVMRAWLYR